MREDRPVPMQYAGVDADARLEALRCVAGETGAALNQVVIAWMRQSNPPMLPRSVLLSTCERTSESVPLPPCPVNPLRALPKTPPKMSLTRAS